MGLGCGPDELQLTAQQHSKNFCGSGDGFTYVPMSAAMCRALPLHSLHLTEGSLMAACHAIGAQPTATPLSVYRCCYAKLLAEQRGVCVVLSCILFSKGSLKLTLQELARIRTPTVPRSCASFADYVQRCDRCAQCRWLCWSKAHE